MQVYYYVSKKQADRIQERDGTSTTKRYQEDGQNKARDAA